MIPRLVFLAAGLALSACTSTPTPPAAGTGPRAGATLPIEPSPSYGAPSPHLPASLRHLDFGGEVFAYYDIEGELDPVIGDLSTFYPLLRKSAASVDVGLPDVSTSTFKDAARILGLFEPRAYGLSSVKISGGRYVNKAFLEMPEGRSGLFKVLAGENRPFETLAMAPETSQLILETDVDGPALIATTKALASTLGGPRALASVETFLEQPAFEGISGSPKVGTLVEALKTRVGLILSAHPTKKLNLPGLDFPHLDYLITIDGLAPSLHRMLRHNFKSSRLAVTDNDHEFSVEFPAFLPIMPALAPVLVADLRTGQMRLATSREFYGICMAKGGGFMKSPAFRAISERIPDRGGALLCLNLEVTSRTAEQVAKTNPASTEEGKMTAVFYRRVAEAIATPVLAVVSQEREGILLTVNAPFSHKSQVMGSGTVLTAGVFTAMAVPAFNRVRRQSSEMALVNDGRLIGNAARQYFLASGKSRVVLVYDPTSGSIGGELKPWIQKIGEGYAIHDNVIEAGNPEAFTLQLKNAFGGRKIPFSDEGRTSASPGP